MFSALNTIGRVKYIIYLDILLLFKICMFGILKNEMNLNMNT